MKAESTRWHPLGDAATPAEAQALLAVQALLPDDAVTHAWPNVSFLDLQGRTAEVDLVLLTQVGFFVVELKGWHGVIDGDQQNWRLTAPSGRVEHRRNPLFATDTKAKRLRSLLESAQPRATGRLPFIGSLVVLHGRNSKITLPDTAKASLLALDGFGVKGLPTLGQFLATAPGQQHLIDKSRAKQVLAAVTRAGFTATPKQRYVGQYSLEKADPLQTGPNWQDLLAVHPSMPDVSRRVRLFDLPPGAAAEAQQQIELAARREFLFTQGVQHTGIAAPLDLVVTDSGSALIFPYNAGEKPLDAYLGERGAELSLEDRLDLLRQLADVLRYAHQRRLVHRGLTPAQVYVTASTPARVVVRDWQTGRRSGGQGTTASTSSAPTATSFGTADVRELIGQGDWIYLAPETHQGGEGLPPVPLDVYGLGALSYLILTGEAPAATIAELQTRLDASGCLDPLVAEPSLPESVADLVRHATARAESDRTVSVEAFLGELDAAYEELTAPDPDVSVAERHQPPDPLTAKPDDAIAERFIVRERRGSGSTGTALLVDDVDTGRTGVVLKIARDDSARRRLEDEAEVLAQLDHPRLVTLLEPPLDVDGRRALLLSDAGKQTLASWLETNGRATLGELQRFGGQLLEAVAYLDGKGLFHRDIKPSNLGIHRDPGTRRPGLVLFDLSLAREPLTNLGSGTRGYLDPFIALAGSRARGSAKTAPRRRFDRAAELYAVAVTLFEMATTQLPWWHEGDGGPQSLQDAAVIDPPMFESAVAHGLASFFIRALAPNVCDRFSDVAAMAQAWHAVFVEIEAQDDDVEDEQARGVAAAQATLDTPLEQAGLSPRALSALGRVQARTVGELLRTPPLKINSLPGLGERYRKEVQRLARGWRRTLLPVSGTETQPSAPVSGDRSIEAYLRRLLPRSADHADVEVMKVLIRLSDAGDGGKGSTAHVTTDGAITGWWPSVGEIATRLGVTRSSVSDAIDAAASRWRRSDVVRVVRAEILTSLAAEEGVASLAELAASLVLRHGSTAEGEQRLSHAAGLVRAVVETDSRSAQPVLAVRRQQDGPVLIAAAPEAMASGVGDSAPKVIEGGPRDVEPRRELMEAVLQDAERLGSAAGDLVGVQGLVSAATARQALRQVTMQTSQFSDDRLLRLAAACCGRVALSSFHELHVLDLYATTATGVALRGVTAARLSPAGVVKRVAGRFPAIPALPGRPELDQLVVAAVPGMRWDGTQYARPTVGASSAASSTHLSRPVGEPVDAVDAQLRASLRHSSALTLCVSPPHHEVAAAVLHRAYGVHVVDVAAALLSAVRRTAERDGVSWSLVLQSDAEQQGGDWANLRDLVADAVREPWATLLTDPRPLLLVNVAPLARYGLSDLLSALLDQSQPRPAARWLLVPRRASQPAPTLDGQPVPLGADRWIDLPADLARLDQPQSDAAASLAALPSHDSGVLA